ncbi:MAG: YihY family inner membrane protein [Deltaproteobacteria bacterium]|nr:YihY family inner membrane protein [Deltaproteobacteria bacterium]
MPSTKHIAQALLIKHLCIIGLACKRFYTDKRILWATSLTYTTVFSLIPLLSVLFFLFNVYGGLSNLRTFIEPYIYETLAPGAQAKVIQLINDLVHNINFSTIGVYGSTVLIISVFLLLFEIEYALNEIWLIKHSMSLISRAAIYWATLTIGPLILAVSLFIIASLQRYQSLKVFENFFIPDILLGLSYVLIWIAFTAIYYFMPGTKVRLVSALFGGIVAGSLWKISGLVFSLYTTNFFFYYPKVYGSLAAIPLFLLWLFLCWILFLLGAEITYFHQNYDFYGKKIDPVLKNQKARNHLAFLLFTSIAQKFTAGNNATLACLAQQYKIPPHLITELLKPLVTRGLLITANNSHCYVPAKSLETIKPCDIISALNQDMDLPDNYFSDLNGNHKIIQRILKAHYQNHTEYDTMKDLIQDMQQNDL